MTIVNEQNGTEREPTCEELLEAAKSRIKELEEALRKVIPDEFKKASTLQDPPTQIWLPAIEAIPFFAVLRNARDKMLSDNKPWRKILFKYDSDGHIRNAEIDSDNGDDIT